MDARHDWCYCSRLFGLHPLLLGEAVSIRCPINSGRVGVLFEKHDNQEREMGNKKKACGIMLKPASKLRGWSSVMGNAKRRGEGHVDVCLCV